MSFLIEVISSLADEVRWRQKMVLEQRIAYSVTSLLALLFIGAAVANAIFRILTGRQARSDARS